MYTARICIRMEAQVSTEDGYVSRTLFYPVVHDQSSSPKFIRLLEGKKKKEETGFALGSNFRTIPKSSRCMSRL
jgi:hypothetical protein